MRTPRFFAPLAFLLSMMAGIPVAAQTTDLTPRSVQADSIRMLRSLLEERQVDRDRMKRILAALNKVDSIYKVQYPTWVLLDEDLRERIFRAFRLRYGEVPLNADVIIVAHPEANELVEVTIGSMSMGRRETYVNLSDSLRLELIQGNYPKRVFDPRPVRPRPFELFQMRPTFAALSLSSFGMTLMFSGSRGIELRLGHEEIGYHFWSTGDMHASVILGGLKLGVIIPFAYGKGSDGPPDPLDLRGRRLIGARGVSMSYDHSFDAHSFGARLSVAEVNRVPAPQVFDPNNSYYIHTVAQGYYSYLLPFSTQSDLYIASAGVGYHQIALGIIQSGPLLTADKEDFISPIFRAEYFHHGRYRYGFTTQFYSGILYGRAWLELIPSFIFLELQYYSPVTRDPKPWEHSYFYMISPRIQVAY